MCLCYLQCLHKQHNVLCSIVYWCFCSQSCAPYEAEWLPAQNLTRMRYLPSFTFQDPIVKVSSLEAFALNLRLLRTVFNVDFELHSCRVAGPTEIVTRCESETDTYCICSRRIPLFPVGSQFREGEKVAGFNMQTHFSVRYSLKCKIFSKAISSSGLLPWLRQPVCVADSHR